MRLSRLCPAVVGVLVAMSLAAPAPAFAEGETTFCKVEKATCPALMRYPAGTTFSALMSPEDQMLLWIKEPGDHVTCTESYFQAKTTTGLHKPLEGELEFFEFTSCPGCSAVTVKGPESTVLILKLAPNIGEMHLHKVLITVRCIGSECFYKAASLPVQMDGTSKLFWGKLTIFAAEFVEEGNVYGCPEKVFLDAEYYVIHPEESLYITN
jgi:hypothetical protein